MALRLVPSTSGPPASDANECTPNLKGRVINEVIWLASRNTDSGPRGRFLENLVCLFVSVLGLSFLQGSLIYMHWLSFRDIDFTLL